jgi:uncharacterized membrane protein
MTPEVIFHASAGALGLISGAAALLARKGERVHRVAGTVFFVVMLTTAGSGALLGVANGEISNTIAGTLTVYFIATSWATVRRAERSIGWFEIGAMIFAALGSAAAFYVAYDSVQKGTALLGGIPFYGFSAVAGMCALFDLSVVLRRGLAGPQRIARHLWRMCLGFFVAVGSFIPGQMQAFPESVQNLPLLVLFIPAFSVVGLMLIWLAIVLGTRRFASNENGARLREPRSA